MARKIAITGADGFIGSMFRKHFAGLGWEVITMSRSTGYHLEKPLSEGCLLGVDVVLHCAYAPKGALGMNALSTNLKGAESLIREVRRSKVKRLTFISSLTAGSTSSSLYGQAKREIEEMLDQNRDLILRPGLVLGDGGLFGRMANFIQRSPIIPLVDGGRSPIRTVHVDDLVTVTADLLEAGRVGLVAIAEPPGPTLGDLIRFTAYVKKNKRLFVSLPASLVGFGLSIAERLKIPLPVARENLMGLRESDDSAFMEFEDFGLRDYRSSIEDLFGSTQYGED